MKKIVKSAVEVSLIYMCAVLLSLVWCDRMSELESREDQQKYYQQVSINLT